MSVVKIDIDLVGKKFILTDKSRSINSDRRFKYFLSDSLNAQFKEDGNINIPFNDDEREQILKPIHDAFEKYNLEQVDSEDVKQLLSSYFNEKHRFKDFSEKAK